MTTLRIATRKSPLALWQTHYIRDSLVKLYPDLQVEIIEMLTKGDKILDTPLAKIGGKGLFVKELEQGILAGEADIAVHSMKDVPVEFPNGLTISIVMKREEPRDAFVSNNYPDLNSLPNGAVVGTASLRRQCQLLAVRPDLQIRSLRGNVGTRLNKLSNGEFDAIILAAAGLKRLGWGEKIRELIQPQVMLPAIAQGAIGIEHRENDSYTRELIGKLIDIPTQQCVTAERALNEKLEGGCQVPIAGHAVIEANEIKIQGLVGDVDGSEIIKSEITGPVESAAKLGTTLAEQLLEQGAERLLEKCRV
ncbi:hydroxymethylbilane synthase [Candidatus Halobeggiatoa sp. HSG11]|nr:hydroxymethylbilane synthase [Candidatus Halobeggiatoa sp. HSG11]